VGNEHADGGSCGGGGHGGENLRRSQQRQLSSSHLGFSCRAARLNSERRARRIFETAGCQEHWGCKANAALQFPSLPMRAPSLSPLLSRLPAAELSAEPSGTAAGSPAGLSRAAPARRQPLFWPLSDTHAQAVACTRERTVMAMGVVYGVCGGGEISVRAGVAAENARERERPPEQSRPPSSSQRAAHEQHNEGARTVRSRQKHRRRAIRLRGASLLGLSATSPQTDRTQEQRDSSHRRVLVARDVHLPSTEPSARRRWRWW
jgi:hypothetical protein